MMYNVCNRHPLVCVSRLMVALQLYIIQQRVSLVCVKFRICLFIVSYLMYPVSLHQFHKVYLFKTALFPADPHNRLREDHNAFFQAFDFHELVCSMHAVINFKIRASKRNAVFQMMHIRSAADRKWFA